MSAAEILAENLNKLKTTDKEDQKHIVSDLKNVIETFAFYFTSMAFEKDSFVKIKEELERPKRFFYRI